MDFRVVTVEGSEDVIHVDDQDLESFVRSVDHENNNSQNRFSLSWTEIQTYLSVGDALEQSRRWNVIDTLEKKYAQSTVVVGDVIVPLFSPNAQKYIGDLRTKRQQPNVNVTDQIGVVSQPASVEQEIAILFDGINSPDPEQARLAAVALNTKAEVVSGLFTLEQVGILGSKLSDKNVGVAGVCAEILGRLISQASGIFDPATPEVVSALIANMKRDDSAGAACEETFSIFAQKYPNRVTQYNLEELVAGVGNQNPMIGQRYVRSLAVVAESAPDFVTAASGVVGILTLGLSSRVELATECAETLAVIARNKSNAITPDTVKALLAGFKAANEKPSLARACSFALAEISNHTDADHIYEIYSPNWGGVWLETDKNLKSSDPVLVANSVLILSDSNAFGTVDAAVIQKLAGGLADAQAEKVCRDALEVIVESGVERIAPLAREAISKSPR